MANWSGKKLVLHTSLSGHSGLGARPAAAGSGDTWPQRARVR